MKHAIPMGLLALAACSTAPATDGPSKPGSPPDATADACGAKALQHLIGKPRSQVPVPTKPELQRVACTTCAITMDFNPERLNIFFDEKTGIIKEVRCG